MALRGLRPVVEIMFGDFLCLCADQIVNHIAKYRAMYCGQVEVPVVIRTPMGGGRGYGPTHSQSIEKYFLGVPHLTVVAPSRFHDPGALLRAAIASPEPVLFIENKLLYPSPLVSPDSAAAPLHLEWIGSGEYPTARLANYSAGKPDVVLFTYGGLSRQLDQVLLRLESEELRVLSLLPAALNHLDMDLLADAAASASAGCLLWEEGTDSFNWSSEVIASLQARLGKRMPPIRRWASAPTVLPACRGLEQAAIPGPETIERAVIEMTGTSLRR
jgi:pyruvate/2-oxoglutarate/acetoin dehydrogenase E1 component